MITAILLAAGQGLRLKGVATPKQFLRIQGKKLYQYTLDTFVKHKKIDQIILVVNEKAVPEVQDEIKPWAKKKNIRVIVGGKTRQESSYQGLRYSQLNTKPDYVLIHDVARPLLNASLIDQLVGALKSHSAITLGRHVNDSLFVVDEQATLHNYVTKKDIYLTQTPQAFQFQTILEAHEHARLLKIRTASDDASLLTLMGKKVHVIPGSRMNFKIVNEDDLSLLKALIKR
jgi:2-C-methyl-D-erythritol 4-phosphate cytidylyltransferase